MRRPQRTLASFMLVLAMALPLAGQVGPDACTASCHSRAMETWNWWYDTLIERGASEAMAYGWANTEGGRVFWGCMGDACGYQ
ncbi:hypothetical protein [Candidatus Palauibacter sp.]|uniref:hypothetical protein n=2 Tax=Candidatus Palauibacter sp. TaxID=3101350 RepID=UPI003CC67434